MPDEIFSAEQVQQYEAARDVLARRIRELLTSVDSCDDPDERLRLELQVAEVSRSRGTLSVGSPQVAELLAQKADQPVPQPRQSTRRT